MAENRFAHGASAGAAAEGYAPLLPITQAPDEEPDFSTEAEEDAYWAGVSDGIRNAGGTPPPRLLARAAGTQLLAERPEEPAPAADMLDFDPVAIRTREGWTPQKQRAFVEALADTGIVRAAAARVGMTEQSANWLRRRADAAAFDRACSAAQRIGARRILSIAYERAIEGTVKRHYFHGELKAEERVYDNRLLIALVNRLPTDHFDRDAEDVERDWEPWMDAIEQGLPAPPPEPLPGGPAPGEPVFEVWNDEGDWLTNCPPPLGFALYQSEGGPGDKLYQRRLDEDEEEYWEATGQEEAEEVPACGGSVYRVDRPTFFPMGYEKAEKSSEAAEEQDEWSEANEVWSERPRPPADGSVSTEPDRRHGFAGTPPAQMDDRSLREIADSTPSTATPRLNFPVDTA